MRNTHERPVCGREVVVGFEREEVIDKWANERDKEHKVRDGRIGGDRLVDKAAHLSLFWLNLFSLTAPITKEGDKRLKLLYSKNFQLASSQCTAVYLIYLLLQWLCCCFHLFFLLIMVCLFLDGCMFVSGMDHCCSTSFPDVLHWSVSNLVLASWQSWLPSGINYASMWFISVGSSTQHSSLPNPIGCTSVAQPLQLLPNQIYWVYVASVSPCLHPPRAITPICPRQFHYIHCSKVPLCKECTVLHQITAVKSADVSSAEALIHKNSSSWMRSWF